MERRMNPWRSLLSRRFSENACRYVEWPTDDPGPLTQRFVDVTVEAAGETRSLFPEIDRRTHTLSRPPFIFPS